MFLDLMKVSERELINMSDTASVIRVGSTERPIKDRLFEYEKLGYKGKMFYAATNHMKDCEDRCLLNARLHGGAKYNFYEQSIASNREGFVYIIQGNWMED